MWSGVRWWTTQHEADVTRAGIQLIRFCHVRMPFGMKFCILLGAGFIPAVIALGRLAVVWHRPGTEDIKVDSEHGLLSKADDS